MNALNTPLLLLNLTKQETQLLLSLYLIYEYENKKKSYTIEEIGKLVGMHKLSVEDTLNKLMMRNIIGRIVYESITDKTVLDNFDEEFLAVLYDKRNPFDSAINKSGFCIDAITKYYFLNPVIKSWKYLPKGKTVAILKRLKKVVDDKFIDYLLVSFNFGKKDDKRKISHSKLNGWDMKQAVEIFKGKYKVAYGNNYDAGTKEYSHMKKLLEQLSINCVPKDNLGLFFDYCFERAVSKEYVLQIAGLRYYANEYYSNVVKK